MLGAMLVAHGVADPVRLQLAILAHQVLLGRLGLLYAQISCAVDHAPEIGLLAGLALVEAACIHGQPGQVLIERAARRTESLVLVQPLRLGYFQGERPDLNPELSVGRNLLRKLETVYVLFAAGALQVGEGDAQGVPLVLQQLPHAIRMVCVAALKDHTGGVGQLARVTYRTKFIG